jgi:hypothetical protein
MSINQEVQVNDDGVRRLGFIVGFKGDDWVLVKLTGQNTVRTFWVEQVAPIGGAA